MKGKFITFEGSEGCGKSTQSKLLYQYLKRKGFKVVYLRDPGGTQICEKIRKILLYPKNNITPLCETLLYMAARAQLVDKIIRPALLRGKMVICDRFLDSTLTYQGYGLGIDISFIKNMGSFVTSGIKPDLTILLDLPVKRGLAKCGHIKDRIERRTFSYHLRVRRGYLKLARQDPKRIKVIEVKDKINKTQGKIRGLINKFLKLHNVT